jgi:hypothetical protein
LQLCCFSKVSKSSKHADYSNVNESGGGRKVQSTIIFVEKLSFKWSKVQSTGILYELIEI